MRNWKDNEPVRSYQARVKRIGPLNVNQRGVFLGPKSVYDEIYGQLDRERETAKQEREYWPKSKRKQARKEKGAAIKTGGNENLILRAEYIVLRSKIEPRLYSMFLPTDQIASHTRRTLTIADGGFVSVHRPCPHLHSAGISAFLHAHRDPGTPWGEHLPCPNAQCQTTLRFEIDKGAYSPIAGIQGKYGKIEPIDEVLLIVERNLGPVRDVMDERWASQLEESHH
jgi:hypothetical protein